MKPIAFKEQNVVIAKDQPEYLPLPAKILDGCVTSCWKLNIIERIIILFTGKIWWQVYSYGQPLQPQRPSIKKPRL